MCPLQPEHHFHLPPHPNPPGSQRALALDTPFSFSFLFFLMLIQTESKSTKQAPINHPHHNVKGSIINILHLKMGKLSFR